MSPIMDTNPKENSTINQTIHILVFFWPHDDYDGNAEQCHICYDTDTTKAQDDSIGSRHI